MNAKKLLKNQEKSAKKEHEEIINRLVPIAEFVLTTMAQHKTPMGEITGTQPQEYKDIALVIQKKFLEEDVKWIDRHFVFQLAQQAMDFVKETTLTHLDKSFNLANQKLWGGKEMHELKMSDVDSVLKG